MKDTEDYINIELDSSQNRLFRLDIVLTAAAFSMEIFHVMGGELRQTSLSYHLIRTVWHINMSQPASVAMGSLAEVHCGLRLTAGILGENVPIPPVITQTVGQFWIVNISTMAVCLIVFTAL
jgi:hypothetical protein